MQYTFRCSLFRHIVLIRRHFPCRKNCTSSECICAFIEDACLFLQPYKRMCTIKFILSVSRVSSDNRRIHNSNFKFWVVKTQRFHELRYPATHFETQNPSKPIETHQIPSNPIKSHQIPSTPFDCSLKKELKLINFVGIGKKFQTDKGSGHSVLLGEYRRVVLFYRDRPDGLFDCSELYFNQRICWC